MAKGTWYCLIQGYEPTEPDPTEALRRGLLKIKLQATTEGAAVEEALVVWHNRLRFLAPITAPDGTRYPTTLRIVYARDVVPGEENTTASYTVNVNYRIDFARALEKGMYGSVPTGFSTENFPTTLDMPDRATREILLFPADDYAHTEDFLAELERRNLRPVVWEELFELGASDPILQRTVTIAALGSLWRNRLGNLFMPVLFGSKYGRGLDLKLFDDTEINHRLLRFAAVEK